MLSSSRTALVAACCILAAAPACAFAPSSLPSTIGLQSRSSFVAMNRQLPASFSGRAPTKTAVSMELLGKRYFLWKIAEKGFDQAIVIGKMVALAFVGLLERMFQRATTNARLKALKNDLRGIKATATLSRQPKVAASSVSRGGAKDLALIKETQALNSQSTQQKEGSQLVSIDAPTINYEAFFSFLMVAVPICAAVVSLVSQDKMIDNFAVSAATAAFLVAMVDLAADTPSGFALNIKKSLPASVRKVITYPR